MNRLFLPLVSLGLAGCSALVPEILRMPAFGSQFQPAIHQQVTPDAVTFVIYRDPSIEERIKYAISVFGVEPTRLTRQIGYVFDGAFLRFGRPAGTWRVIAFPWWWNDNPPAGESFLGRMNVGEPPMEDGVGIATIGGAPAVLELELQPGTVTYLKLTRSVSNQIEICVETTQTIELCEVRSIQAAFELVPGDSARADLTGLKETIYGAGE